MKKSAFISDILFAFFLGFLFTLCLFRFLRVRLFPSFLLAIVCGTLLACSVWAVLSQKRKNFFLKKADEKQKEKLLLHLALLSPKDATELFCSIFQGKRIKNNYIQTENAFLFIHCAFSPLAADDVADFFRISSDKERTIYCAKIEEPAQALCARLKITVKKECEIYLLFKEHDALPLNFLGDFQQGKITFFKRKATFAKSNSNRFFVSGAFLLLSSLITPFPLYYLIFGSILLLTATLTRIFGQE